MRTKQTTKSEQRRSHNIADGIRAALLMPFKSRSQEDLFVGASPSSADASDTCRDDHTVAMTMTSLLLLRPDASTSAAADAVMSTAVYHRCMLYDCYEHVYSPEN